LLIGFNDINQWSLLDENEHVQGNIDVLNLVRPELTEEENKELSEFLVETVNAFVEAEHHFIELVYKMGDLEGLSKQDLKDYISYLGELRLSQLGEIPSYSVRDNPLQWVDYLLMAKSHDNFFEKRVTDYSHTKLSGDVDYSRYLKYINK
jgi:ribonucleoside-diphosphate reductase beta chain